MVVEGQPSGRSKVVAGGLFKQPGALRRRTPSHLTPAAPASPRPPCPPFSLQDKTRHLKQTLNAQFRMIHELCSFVLLNTRRESLVRATLTALHAYLSWVPVG